MNGSRGTRPSLVTSVACCAPEAAIQLPAVPASSAMSDFSASRSEGGLAGTHPTPSLVGSSDTEPPLLAEAPIYVAARRDHADDLAAELLFQRLPPGHELEPHAIVDHGEAAGRECDPLAVDTRDVLAPGGRAIMEPRLR